MAGAGLWTTPADLTRLELEIAAAAAGESSLLRRDLAGQMLTRQVPDGMGLGTELQGEGGRLRFGHSGSNIGYTCVSYSWPGAGTAVAVMTNSEGGTELLCSILAAAQRLYAPGAESAGNGEAADVTGRYLLADGRRVDVEAADAGLTFAIGGEPPVALTRSPGSTYQLPGLDCEISFEPQAGSPVLRLSQEGSTAVAPRQAGKLAR